MGDTASWFYKTRIPEIQEEHNLTYSEALIMGTRTIQHTKDKVLYKHTDHETIEIDLKDDQILHLALDAHKNNITLNQHIINIIKDFIDNDDQEVQPKQQLLTEKKNDKVQKRKV